MSLPILLYSGPSSSTSAAVEAARGKLDIIRVEPVVDEFAAGLPHAVALLDASMKVRVNAAMIDQAGDLRVVAVAATGADHIDDRALLARGIPLLTLRGETEVLRNLTPAAEHSWLLLLACARQLVGAAEHVRQAQWNRTDFPGMMLRGRTLGLIGVGRIGGWMARYAEAFGMRCLGYDPGATSLPATVERRDLESLLDQSDIVSLHVPLLRDNAGFFDAGCFARMKRGSIFINTSRGDLTDEAALLRGLEDGHLAAAGLDVLTGEPDIESHPLRAYAVTHGNLVITPHIGGFSPDAVDIVVRHSVKRILEYLNLPAA